MKDFIFGYGSLMEKESRQRTTPDVKKVYPVKVKGFQRGWFGRTGTVSLSTTFLGCVKNDEDSTNGVIYQVNKNDIQALDKREQGYERVKIRLSDIKDYSGVLNEDCQVWIYANVFKDNIIPEEFLPSKKFPIVQSYVDMCIEGCLEIEAEYETAREDQFAIDFVKTTSFWSEYWVNDRIYPRRPFIYRPNSSKIDKILKENLPDTSIFEKIYFE